MAIPMLKTGLTDIYKGLTSLFVKNVWLGVATVAVGIIAALVIKFVDFSSAADKAQEKMKRTAEAA